VLNTLYLTEPHYTGFADPLDAIDTLGATPATAGTAPMSYSPVSGTSGLSQDTLQMGPNLYQRDWWVGYQYNSLSSAMRAQLKTNCADLHLRFGSDGTGANAFLEAIRGIEHFLNTHIITDGPGLCVDNIFGSEHSGNEGEGACKFIMSNDPPTTLYRDMHLRGHSGVNSLTGDTVLTPYVHMYGASPECKDQAGHNNNPVPVDALAVSESSGRTSKTMASIHRYWSDNEPAVTVLEEINKDAIVREFYRLFRSDKKPYFDIEIFATNTDNWRLPHLRNRIFLVAVNLRKVTLMEPVHMWQHHMLRMMDSMPKMCLQDFLIHPDTDTPEVTHLLTRTFDEWESAAQKRKPTDTLLHKECGRQTVTGH